MRIHRRAYDKWREDGILALFGDVPRYLYANHLRDLLPTRTEIFEFNDVEVPVETGVFDEYVPGYTPPTAQRPGYEAAELDAIREYCRAGDEVVIVGGGYGVTPVIAAGIVGETGHVVVYEPSLEMVSRIRATAEHHGRSDDVTVEHAGVGEILRTWGETGAVPVVPAADLPDCDFLELDCEGAEESIIENLDVSPRVISVETHEKYGVSHQRILDTLTERGYEIAADVEKEGKRHVTAMRSD